MKKTAFLFSGQGAQYPGMMADLAENYPEVKEIFDTADRTLGRSISDLCFHGSPAELALTHNTQPCMLAADLAAYAAAKANGLQPDAVAGFSLGEYAALVVAGVLSLEDAFTLVQLRADAMQNAVAPGEGAMAAVMKLSSEEVEALCQEVEGYVIPANYNSPAQITVSGEAKAVDNLIALAKERKIRTVKLAVSAPFHCQLMAPAADRLAEAISSIPFKAPSMPIYLNVDGCPEADPEKIKEKVVLQAKSPVRWINTLQNMEKCGFTVMVELGPGQTLTGFVKKTVPQVLPLHIEDLASLQTTTLEFTEV